MNEEARHSAIRAIAEEADQYAGEYNQSIVDLESSLGLVRSARSLVDTDRQTVKEMEIRAAATATGSNEAQRKAEALRLLLADLAYDRVSTRLRLSEERLAGNEADAAIATERCRAARCMLEVSAAHLRALAPS